MKFNANTQMVAVLALSSALVSGCSLVGKSGSVTSAKQGLLSLDGSSSGPSFNGTAQVKDYLQLVSSMETVTGLAPYSNFATIKQYYNTVGGGDAAKTRLSNDGRAPSLSAASLLATVGMAGLFCQELVNNRASASPMYANAVAIAGPLLAGIDFTKVPQTGLPAASRSGLATRLYTQFLGRAPSAQESTDLVAAMADMEAGLTAGGPTQAGTTLAARAATANDTRDVVIGACTAVLGNLEFISN